MQSYLMRLGSYYRFLWSCDLVEFLEIQKWGLINCAISETWRGRHRKPRENCAWLWGIHWEHFETHSLHTTELFIILLAVYTPKSASQHDDFFLPFSFSFKMNPQNLPKVPPELDQVIHARLLIPSQSVLCFASPSLYSLKRISVVTSISPSQPLSISVPQPQE